METLNTKSTFHIRKTRSTKMERWKVESTIQHDFWPKFNKRTCTFICFQYFKKPCVVWSIVLSLCVKNIVVNNCACFNSLFLAFKQIFCKHHLKMSIKGNAQTMKFINLWKNHQCLWQVGCVDYKNANMCDMAIAHIANEMAVSKEAVKAKIKSLRTQVGDNKKKLKKGLPLKWIFWEPLQFIRDFMVCCSLLLLYTFLRVVNINNGVIQFLFDIGRRQ